MEAPEKIYVTECMLFATNPEITLPDNNSIEYIRTDAFIEKACGWIKEKWDDNYTMPIIIDSVIEDFKNYVKRE